METTKFVSVMLLAIALLALPASAKTVTVTVGPGISFTPASVTINVGDIVNWAWAPGSVTHSTTSGNCCTPDGTWDSGTMNSGNFSHTFNSVGTFNYFCSIHLASMTGSVTVLAPPPPTFTLSITSPATLTAFPNQPASFTGALTAQNGYNTPTPLSCIAGNAGPVPSPCTPNPASPTPSPTGMPFSVAATGSSPQDYQFKVMAAGTPSNLTQTSPNLTLHVVDFDFALPASVAVPANGASSPQNVPVSALNSFSGMVDLACSGLPAGAACNFSPASVPAGTASKLTVTTTHALQGPYTVTVTGTSGVASHVHTFTLNVQADYTLGLASPVLTLFPGQAGNFSVTLAAQDGYTGAITLACGTFDATISCTPPAAAISLNNANPSAGFNVAIATNSPGTTLPNQYVANLTATDSNGLPTHTVSATVNVVDFQLTPPAGVSVAVGNPTPALTVQVKSLGSLTGAVDLACPSNPVGFVCHFSPASVVPSALGVNVTLVVTTPSNATTTAITVAGTSRNSGAPQEVTRSVSFNVTVTSPGTTADLLVAIQHQSSQSPDVTPVGQPLTYQVSLSDKLGGSISSTVLLTFSSPVSFGVVPLHCTTGADFISCPMTTTGTTPVTITVETIVPFARTITASAFASCASTQSNASDNFAVDTPAAQVRPRPFARKGLPPKSP